MRGTMMLAVILAALALSACPAHCRSLTQAATPIRWCIPADADAATVQACTTAVAGANTATLAFSCVAGGSDEGCMDMIATKKTAELTTVGATGGAESMLLAHETYKLEPIAAEFYSALQEANYYSVAAVDAAFCTAGVTLANLKGARACHTGYRRTAGWVMPIGYLAETGVMPLVNSDATVNADAQSAAAFFSAICAASEAPKGPLASGDTYAGLCTACAGNCSTTDPYYDYDGAVRGLMEGKCDVAFTKHSTVIDSASNGAEAQSWSLKSKDDLRLLCKQGGCKTLDEFATCNIAKAPTYAIMSRADIKSAPLGASIQAALEAAGAKPDFLAAVAALPGDAAGLVVSEDTQGIRAVDEPFIEYFGASTKEAFEGIKELEELPSTPATPTPATPTPATPTPATPTPATPATGTPAAPAAGSGTAGVARWCIPFPSDAAFQATCNAAVAKGNTAAVTFQCTPGGSQDVCLGMITSGQADLILLGGSEQLPAHEENGLEAIAAEFYGDVQGASYFSVAVVNKEFCTPGVTLDSLKGKKSCHTGYRKTAGWMMPVGYLNAEGVIPKVDSNDQVQADAEGVASFFASTCAPGITDEGPTLGGGKYDGLCTGCKGDCSESDPYYDYAGSLRCLMEGAGDVAFTKHTTALTYTKDGSEAQPWSTKSKADLMLLCPSGGCAAVDKPEDCNIAKVPARAVMSRAEMQTSALGKAVKDALVKGGAALVESMTSIGGEENFVFGDTAQSVLSIDTPFMQFYTSATKEAYDQMTALDAIASGTAEEPSSGGSSGVSSGAAAGIGIGCAVAGALLGALAMMWVGRRRGWQRHTEAPVMSGSAAPSEAYKM